MLLSLSICLMIVLNVPSIIRVLKIPVVSYNQDIAVGAKQLADYLIVSKIKTYSEDIGYYDEKGEENKDDREDKGAVRQVPRVPGVFHRRLPYDACRRRRASAADRAAGVPAT